MEGVNGWHSLQLDRAAVLVMLLVAWARPLLARRLCRYRAPSQPFTLVFVCQDRIGSNNLQ